METNNVFACVNPLALIFLCIDPADLRGTAFCFSNVIDPLEENGEGFFYDSLFQTTKDEENKR